MRVIGGISGGLVLKGPVDGSVRPTTERVRGAIFNILSGEIYINKKILDLFSGTGSLGIEALSRGASHCDFVEKNPKQLEILKTNLGVTNFLECASLYRQDAFKFLESLEGPYNMILMDPPYKLSNLPSFMEYLSSNSQLFSSETIIVIGHSKRMPLDESYGTLSCIDSRNYGDNAIKLYKSMEGK